MKVNADFSQRAIVHAGQVDWVASPIPGVSRRMLDRIGGEVARATSIVRYEPGSRFSPHVHSGGEEYIVLDGVFQDEHGDFPVGSYVRNPINTEHTPASAPGCQIFVKLWQFDPAETDILRVDMNAVPLAPERDRPGVSAALLHEDPRETVKLETWEPGAAVALGHDHGAELLVLQGSFEVDGEVFEKHSWLRLPNGERATAGVGQGGARVWMKTGHLPFVRVPPQA